MRFFCDAVIATVEELEQTLGAVDRIAAEWKARLDARADSHVYPAIDLLRDMPIVSASILAEQLGISKQSANTVLGVLAEKNIVRERTGYKRNRIFAADRILSIFNRPFGEAPILDTPPSNSSTFQI